MITRAIIACLAIQFATSAPADIKRNGCPDANAGFHAEVLNARWASNEYLEYDDEYLFEMETDDMDNGYIAGVRYRFEVDQNDGDISMRNIVVTAMPYGQESTCGFGEFPAQNWVNARRDCPNVAIGEFKPTDMAGFHWRAPQCGCVIFRVAVLTESDEYFMDSDSTIAGPLTRVVCEQRSNIVPGLLDTDLGIMDPDYYGLDEEVDTLDAITDAIPHIISDAIDDLFSVDSLEDDLTDEDYDSDPDWVPSESDYDYTDGDSDEIDELFGIDSLEDDLTEDNYDSDPDWVPSESDYDYTDEESDESDESDEKPGRWHMRGHGRRGRWPNRKPANRRAGRITPRRPYGRMTRHEQGRPARNGIRGAPQKRGRVGALSTWYDNMMKDAPAATHDDEVDVEYSVDAPVDEGYGVDAPRHHRRGPPHHKRGHHHKGHRNWHDRDHKMDRICTMADTDRISARKEAWLNKQKPNVASRLREEWAKKAEKVKECCDMETRDDTEKCFRWIHNEKIDRYCAGESGARIVNRGMRTLNRNILKETCCQKEGEERFDCFHNKHDVLRTEKTPDRKMEFICSKLERKPKKHRRVLKRIDDKDDRDDWENIFELRRAGLAECCAETSQAEKMECMQELREERVDAMCDDSAEWRPFGAMKKGDRHREKFEDVKGQCCHLDGTARYNCFNKTLWQRRREDRRRPCENPEDCDPHQRHLECCQAGRTFSRTLDDPSWRVCRASAVDYAKEQTMGRICMAKYKSCCMQAAARDDED